jgi:hypothetical protein
MRSPRNLLQGVVGLCAVLTVALSGAVQFARGDDVAAPKGAGPLPDLAKGAKAGATVTAQHTQLYRMLVPPEVASILDRGELAFEAVLRPRDPARFETLRQSDAPAPTMTSSGIVIDASGGKALVSPMFDLPRSAVGDLVALAYKVLWNTASLGWRHPSFARSLSVLIFKTPEAEPRKLEFEVDRVHPRKLGEVTGTLEPIFRERISARRPSVIDNLSWLTLRFFGSGEDFVWTASPVINSIRQMTGSNRSDALFTGLFSPDDLFVWSGKVELVEPSGLTLLPMLVPLLETKESKVEVQENCVVRTTRGEGAIALNHQSGRFKGAGGWVPTNTVMALRAVWRVELTSRDPFSLDPRQTLYVDRDSGLPVYRVVWDDAGRLRRVTLGILRSFQHDGGSGGAAEVALAGQVQVHGSSSGSSSGSSTGRLVLLTDSFTNCSGYQPGRKKVDFDPSTFARYAPVDPQGEKKVEELKEAEET